MYHKCDSIYKGGRGGGHRQTKGNKIKKHDKFAESGQATEVTNVFSTHGC